MNPPPPAAPSNSDDRTGHTLKHLVRKTYQRMASTGPRLAVIPIPYWLSGTTAHKSTAKLGKACEELAAIRYTAVKSR